MTISFFVFCLLLVTGLSVPIKRSILEHPKFRRGADEGVVEGQYIVKLKEGADPAFNGHRAWLNGVQSEAERGRKVKNFSFKNFQGYSASLEPETVMEILNHDDVESVELNRIVKGDATQTVGLSASLDRLDQINLPLDGSFSYEQDGSGVTIYVLDSGTLTNHDEFLPSQVSLVQNYISPAYQDCHGHGTHVAALAAGQQTGVAKGAIVKALRVLDCNNEGTVDDLIAGLSYVASQLEFSPHKAVINLSVSTSLTTALNQAVEVLLGLGAVVVASSGNNNGMDACGYSPASVPGVITVAATNPSDVYQSFSNKGSCVDILAPGFAINSAWIIPTTTISSVYNTLSGTSQAAAMVSGVAAMYLQYYSPGTDIKAKIVESALQGVVSQVPVGTPNKLLHISFESVVASCPPYPGSGDVNPQPYSFPSSLVSETPVYGECDPLYEGTVQRICTESGWSVTTGSCTPITCIGDQFGFAQYPNTNAGSEATGTCIEGYYSNDPVVLSCDSDGNWQTPPSQACLPVTDCPPETAFGADWYVTAPGEEAEGQCVFEDDTTVYIGTGVDREIGSPVRSCDANGEWEEPSVSCVPITACVAGEYHTETFGLVLPETMPDNTVNPMCSTGYEASQPNVAYCNEEGAWEITDVFCVPVKCAQDTLDGASFPEADAYVTVEGTCAAGHVSSQYPDPPTAYCQADGTFTVNYGCSPIADCPAGDAGNAEFPSASPGTTVQGTCLETFASSPAPSRTCTAAGSWEPPTTTCNKIYCPPITSAQASTGFARFESTAAGTTAVGSCNINPYLESPTPAVQLVCYNDGTWASSASGQCSEPSFEGCPAFTDDRFNSVWPSAPLGTNNVVGTCINGLSGTPRRNCLWDGTWANVKRKTRCR